MLCREISRTEDFLKINSAVSDYKRPLAVFGLSKTARTAYISALQQKTNRPVLVLCADERSSNKIYEDLSFFSDSVCMFPHRDLILRSVEGYSHEYEYLRIKALGNLVGGRANIIVAPIEAIMLGTIPKRRFLQATKTIKSTDTIKREEIIECLLQAGYVRRDMVEGAGQFSVRGDIVDFFTPDMPYAVRIELWGNEIDRINTFDIADQRRMDKINKVHISPVKEVLFTDTQDALAKIEEFRKTLSSKRKNDFDRCAQDDINMLHDGLLPVSMDKYMSVCYETAGNLLDYMDNPVIVLDNWNDAKENYKNFSQQFLDTQNALIDEDIVCRQLCDFYRQTDYIFEACVKNATILFDDFARSENDFKLSGIITISCGQNSGWNGEYKLLQEDLQQYISNGYKVIILAGTKKYAQTIAGDLAGMGYSAVYSDKDIYINRGSIVVTQGKTSQGFILPNEKICLITGQKEDISKKPKTKKKNKDAIVSIDQISRGDYVVHQNYGVGIYDGIENVSMQGVTKDYLRIKYAGSDSLFVPVTQLDLISLYTMAKDEENVKLSKLGSESWNRTKRKARKATQEMAKELIELYAKRLKTSGYAFDADTEWQRDFEARFIYDETVDQLIAISEIKKDMESPSPMERLLCGDVGVGKTEVALRAAFKAVMSGKQVAILVPTTVLAWQHYNTIVQRMENFPVNVQLLSRFRTPKQRAETLRDISTGVADIVVGTHALIQKSVHFKNLGLLIIDEEQRFGVEHKDKLLEGNTNIDVLSLSATPIPRTLSMALNGIRDMSTIEQPPHDRIPVETYVCEYNEKMIANAINRELNRGGQVYYLHNHVGTIDLCASKVAQMAPDARIGIAHGQMNENELSKVWRSLMNGEIDILVCTTIIETGVDVSNCNTLIIENSDHMGLSQLYQIRGRVGRSSRKAYAYLTFRRDKVLTEIAVKRLNAIKEFTTFGSGYKIAMRDLQIRGAGSVLGKTQSGFMASIGYDLYIKLLNQAIALEKGENVQSQKSDCVVDISTDAYIPREYIQSTQNRIEIYKRIAALENDSDVSDLIDELIDRYGDVPQSVMGLIDISMLRVAAAKLQVTEIKQIKNTITLYGSGYGKIDMLGFIKSVPFRVSISDGAKPFVTLTIPAETSSLDAIKYAVSALEDNIIS